MPLGRPLTAPTLGACAAAARTSACRAPRQPLQRPRSIPDRVVLLPPLPPPLPAAAAAATGRPPADEPSSTDPPPACRPPTHPACPPQDDQAAKGAPTGRDRLGGQYGTEAAQAMSAYKVARCTGEWAATAGGLLLDGWQCQHTLQGARATATAPACPQVCTPVRPLHCTLTPLLTTGGGAGRGRGPVAARAG